MILLWAGAALAASCCASVSSQPDVLDRCDALGVALGLGADLAYGGWGWDGAWSGAGDDGGGGATASTAILGRLAPWLQGGVRVPLRVEVARLDGTSSTALGLGNALLWLDAEAPARNAAAARVGVQLGLGTAPTTAAEATLLQGSVRASGTLDAWSIGGTLSARVAVLGHAAPDGDAALVLDHTAGPRARVGLAAAGTFTGGATPGGALLLGPSLVLGPTRNDRVRLGAQASLPIDHFGRNAASRVLLSVEAFRVLAAAAPG